MNNFIDIIPATVGLAIGIGLTVHRLGWLETNKVKDKYHILIPSIVFLFSPFLLTYINSHFSSVKNVVQIGTLVSVIVGVLKFSWDQNIKRDEVIIREAVLSLERAYGILTDQGKNLHPPRNDRYLWLKTARMLLSYKFIKKGLRTQTYRLVCETQEEYWRHCFFQIIDKRDFFPKSYFKQSSKNYIDPKSTLVIYSFAEWQEGRVDPTDEDDILFPCERENLLKKHRGLRDYLNENHLNLVKKIFDFYRE